MRLAQLGGHGALVVEVGEAGVRVQRPGVQYALRRLLDLCPLGVGGGGPGEVVVDDGIGVLIIAFCASTYQNQELTSIPYQQLSSLAGMVKK